MLKSQYKGELDKNRLCENVCSAYNQLKALRSRFIFDHSFRHSLHFTRKKKERDSFPLREIDKWKQHRYAHRAITGSKFSNLHSLSQEKCVSKVPTKPLNVANKVHPFQVGDSQEDCERLAMRKEDTLSKAARFTWQNAQFERKHLCAEDALSHLLRRKYKYEICSRHTCRELKNNSDIPKRKKHATRDVGRHIGTGNNKNKSLKKHIIGHANECTIAKIKRHCKKVSKNVYDENAKFSLHSPPPKKNIDNMKSWLKLRNLKIKQRKQAEERAFKKTELWEIECEANKLFKSYKDRKIESMRNASKQRKKGTTKQNGTRKTRKGKKKKKGSSVNYRETSTTYIS